MRTFIILFLLICQNIYAQKHENRFAEPLVIVTKCNVRQSPDINGKILGQFTQGYQVKTLHLNGKLDTLEGIIGAWTPVDYKGETGYVWSKTISYNSFKSQKHPHRNIIFGFTFPNEIRVVQIENNQTISDRSFSPLWLKPKGKDIEIQNFYRLIDFPEQEVFQIGWYNRDIKKMEYRLIELKENQLVNLGEKHIPSFQKLNLANHKDSLFQTNKSEVEFLPRPDYKEPEITKLDIGTFIIRDYSKLPIKQESENPESEGYWIPVKYNGQNGFIWWKNLEKRPETYKSIYSEAVYKITNQHFSVELNGKQTDRVEFKHFPTPEYITSFPNNYFTGFDELIKITYFGGGCGKPSGDILYGRKGEKLVYLFENSSMMDGSYGVGGFYTLLGKDSLGLFSSESELLIDLNGSSPITKSYSFNVYKQLYYWNGKNLQKLKSKYDVLNNLANKRNWKIDNQFYFDINNDGQEDIIGVFRKITKKQTTNIELSKEGIIVIFLKDKHGNYTLFGENHTIYKTGYSATNVKATKKGLQLEIVYSDKCIGCYSTNAKDYGYKTYYFEWLKDKLTLKRTKWINQKNYSKIEDLSQWLILNNYNNTEFNLAR
jgi:hypothetical protein